MKRRIVEQELIGTYAEIIDAGCKNYVGIKGKIIDETKNTFFIEDEKIRVIPKKGVKFRIRTSNGNLEINGSMIVHRPEDRIKKLG